MYPTIGAGPTMTCPQGKVVWSMNAPEYYLLLTSRRWTPAQYAALVRDVWLRTLLRNPPPPPPLGIVSGTDGSGFDGHQQAP